MKAFLNNTFVHVVIVGLFGLGTQILTGNGWDTLTLGFVFHGFYEWYLAL